MWRSAKPWRNSRAAWLGVCQGAVMGVLMSCLPIGPIDGPDENGRIDFESARVVPNSRGEPELIVRGWVPTPCHDVSLRPVTYITEPDYWMIQVIAETDAEMCAEVVTPYEARLVLDGSIGSRGIEVVGRTERKKIDVSK